MASNPDLWEELLALSDQREVEFMWVRGHDGHVENGRRDRWAAQAATQPNLPVDEGYESEAPPNIDASTLLEL